MRNAARGLKAAGKHAAGRAPAVLLVTAVIAVGLLVVARSGGTTAPQPIRFNHQVHVKKEPCATCHRYFKTREVAGRPDMPICMDCHTNPVTESPEENKLRRFAEARKPLLWQRLTRMPPHVRFSHQRHVVAGGIACEACHGEIAQTTAPPPRALVEITMEFCIGCHQSETIRVAPAALKALRNSEVDVGVLAGLSEMRNIRFDSETELLNALESELSAVLPESGRTLVLRHLRAAPAPSTDCIACHR